MFWVSDHPGISSATGLSMLVVLVALRVVELLLVQAFHLGYMRSARFLVTTLTQQSAGTTSCSNDCIWKLFAQDISILSISASFKIEAKKLQRALFTASLCKDSFSAFLLPREELSIEWGQRAHSCKKARLSSSLCCKSS